MRAVPALLQLHLGAHSANVVHRARMRLGRLLGEAGRWKEALGHFEACLARATDRGAAHRAVAVALLHCGYAHRAALFLAKALRLFPRDVALLCCAADAALALDCPAEALPPLDTALALVRASLRARTDDYRRRKHDDYDALSPSSSSSSPLHRLRTQLAALLASLATARFAASRGTDAHASLALLEEALREDPSCASAAWTKTLLLASLARGGRAQGKHANRDAAAAKSDDKPHDAGHEARQEEENPALFWLGFRGVPIPGTVAGWEELLDTANSVCPRNRDGGRRRVEFGTLGREELIVLDRSMVLWGLREARDRAIAKIPTVTFSVKSGKGL
jgi:tetratricopeptide (TPR) repeat protein